MPIRPGSDDDASGFIDLIGACWAEYATVPFDVVGEVPEILALASHVAKVGGALWTAEQDGRVVGMTATYPAADGWVLSRVYVESRLRGTGLAQRFLRLAEDHARAAGATRMTLWSDVLFTRAHAFYEKHGYVRRGGLRVLPDQPHVIEAGYAKPLTGLVVEALDVAAAESAEPALSPILCACVQDGAATSFLPPLSRDRAKGYWRTVAGAVARDEAQLFVAWRNGTLAGAVQLDLAMPETQPHRADIGHLLVATTLQREEVGRALLQAAEQAAVAAGRRLLVWPACGNEAASVSACGWIEAGVIPGDRRDSLGHLHDTRLIFKRLRPPDRDLEP